MKFLFILIFTYCSTQELKVQEFQSKSCETDFTLSKHLFFGNISCAKNDLSSKDNFLLIKKQYVLSYNDTNAYPNWVSWELNSSWLGDEKRSNDFRRDKSLPESFKRISKDDYSNSGFDKGHLCPSGDRTATKEDNSETFLLSNMIPQSPRSNRGTWKYLEEFARKEVSNGKELYIIAGAYGVGGVGTKGYEEILVNKITVPSRTWKLIAIFPEKLPLDTSFDLVSKARLIAVDMPNSDEAIEKDWKRYRVSIDSIEEKTGFDFFKHLPKTLETEIESKVDDL
ncbi:MAG: DNA/RNA non-specific endonuclease [Leptospiraceae bacterium]|nr:DNA/RNA non-specific endonuclease [Leptospiraceae bacterium]